MKKFFHFLKWPIRALLISALILALFNFSLIIYGINQLTGQLHIILNARPMQEVLDDKSVPDSLKQKIHLIEEIKKFAIDSLKLKDTKNYTTFYDQHNKPLLWVITASDPFKIKPFQWKFPLLGSVSYKGFFDYDAGKSEELNLKSKGYDTDYGDVSAWSTLGWFRDPILSNMLYRSEGQLAELIIHEMTHSTLYLKSNVDINENLASVCGEQGAIRYLTDKYRGDSQQLLDYVHRKDDYDLFSSHMLRGKQKLDSLYSAMNDSLTIIKKKNKDQMIRSIINSLDTISFHSKKRYSQLFKNELPNNAYFINFVRYDSQKLDMKRELTERFKGDIISYINSLRSRY